MLTLLITTVTPTKANSADSQMSALLDGAADGEIGNSFIASCRPRGILTETVQDHNRRASPVGIIDALMAKLSSIRNSVAESQQNKKLKTELFPTDSLAVAIRRLIIKDRVTDIKFLVDSGCLDYFCLKTQSYSHYRVLYTANGTIIFMYGQKLLQLDLGFRIFQWPFIITNVDTFIIGSNFLAHFNLLLDI